MSDADAAPKRRTRGPTQPTGTSPARPLGERLLTPEEVAERLALSPVTVGHMLRAGELPGVKVKTLWRVRVSDLDAYILALPTPKPRPPRQHKPPKDAAPSAAAKANATRGPEGRSAAAKKAAATKAAKKNPPADVDAPDEDAERPPTEAERVAWASAGVSEADDVYTPEYREWLAQKDADAGPKT